MRRPIIMLATALLISTTALAQTTYADQLSDLRQSIQKRAPALMKLIDAGVLGETWDGYVAAVNGQSLDRDAKAVMDAENADRKQLYQLIGQKRGIPAAKVGQINAIEKFKRAKPNHWLKLQSGQWKQRKDVRIEK